MSDIVPVDTGRTPTRRINRRTLGALRQVDQNTLLREANVRQTSNVQTRKIRELNRTSREAMHGYAFLSEWAHHLSGDNLMLRDELNIFMTAARLGAAEIIADMVDTYCEESRRHG